MSPQLVAIILVLYFVALSIISFITSRGADSNTFFTANRQSPWYLVAFGMIGTSLSGVTFVSVPGNVGSTGFSYFQIVLGYLVGYWVILTLLLPLFYRLKLTSIYGYLDKRFDKISYKTGSFFFLLSRTMGSSLRLFLAASILQFSLFQAWGVPFYFTVAATIFFIWIYTFKGGIKTIVWTDMFQTFFLLASVIVSIYVIGSRFDKSFEELFSLVWDSDYARVFHFEDVNSKFFFPKQFVGGAFIAIAMTGLDQDMMQKNLTCKNVKEAQKNMFWFSLILIFVNLLFLSLGALLHLYSTAFNLPIPSSSDELFPMIALNEFGLTAGIFFLLGIIASSYSSADSALTALTTSFCVDFLHFEKKKEKARQKQKKRVHIGFSLVIFIIILLVKEVNEASLIDAVLILAGYTYGPLLGLFAFGIFTKKKLHGLWTPFVCIGAACLSFLLATYSEVLLNGYQLGIETLVLNGAITFGGLHMIARKA